MVNLNRSQRCTRAIASLALTATAVLVAACGSSMAFSDSSALVIKGDPPAPPPQPEPEPPKPKRVEVTQDKIVIHEKIQFEFDKAVIRPESHGLLDEIVGVIKDNPHIKKISIEGHTDSQGSDKYNEKLSKDRAASVLAYFKQHGVAEGRLTSKGWGEAKPLASNDTDEGKEKNRRVEFIITEQEEVKKTFVVDPKTGQKQEVEGGAQ
jgi:OOP family OmpA-OmpF porin